MVDLNNTDAHLYDLVARDLKKKIREYYFGQEGKIPNYLQLTEMYDVSMSTIKKAMKILNDEHVLVSRVGKGTFANKAFLEGSLNGHSIKKNGSERHKTGKVGLMIRDIDGPYFSGIYKALADKADTLHQQLMLTVSRDFHQQEDSLLRMMMAHEVDGILLTTRRKSIFGSRIYDLLYEQHIPTVLLHDVYDAKLPIVDVNNYLGGALAAEHLLKHVTGNLSVIVGEHGFRADDLRLEGFLDTLKQHDIDIENRCHVFRYSFGAENTAFDEGYKLGMSLAVKNLNIGGIFLFNDLIAMGFQKAMLERGISIPQDIRVIGFDNIERCTEARIPLTTIEVPRYEIGVKAYEILRTFMRDGHSKVPPRTLLDPKLIIRDSA